MKHPSVASPDPEEDDVSECTMSYFDYSALRQAMMFSKVRRSRLRLILVSISILLSCLLLFLFFPPSSTPQPLLQSEVEFANIMNKKFEKSSTWIGDLEKALKIAERKMSEFEQINHDQAATIKYAHDPFSIEELVAKVKEATELQIESKLQVIAGMMIAEFTGKMNEAFFKHDANTCRIGEFEKASQVFQPTMIAEKEECVVFKNLQSNWTEKCSEKIMASEEMNATGNESMSKKNMARVLVQEDKEATGKGKEEMVSQFELLMLR